MQREYRSSHSEGSGFLEIKLLDKGTALQVTYQDIFGEIEDKFVLTRDTQTKLPETKLISSIS